MILYCYDKDGLYVGPISPRLNTAKPFDGSGNPNYLRPGRTTETPPPTLGDSQAAQWTGTAWQVIEDHRRKDAYSKTTGIPTRVMTVGPLPDGYTLEKRPTPFHVYEDGSGWTFSLTAARTSGQAQIDAHAENLRNTVITPGSGQLWSYIAKGYEAAAFVLDAEPTAEKYPHIYGAVGTTDGATAAEVAATYIRCGTAWKAFSPAIENVRRRAKDAIATATSLTEIESIIASAAWPVFGA